jgi:hypothetical protein
MNTNTKSKKSSQTNRLKSERASVIVEFAFTAPLLLTLIIAIVGTGNVLMQLPWSANTAYQLASTLAENPTTIGQLAMESRLDQLRIERNSLFSNLGLTQQHVVATSFHDNINGVEVVGVRFNANILPLMNIQLPNALRIELTAPHLAASVDVSTITGFANPADNYDCCGIRCGDPGSNCGVSCYDSNEHWAAACSL